jgi:four helix bundle protein
MTTATRFEELIVWQRAKELAVSIYQVYGASKDYGFRDQIQRAAVSIMNNIAEGFGRKGNKEFTHYLYIAKGSCAEVRSMLYLAEELKYTTPKVTVELRMRTEDISNMLAGLIRSLHSR